jgi:hypothetical protein
MQNIVDAICPGFQRAAHGFEMLRVIVVATGDGSWRMVQDALYYFIGYAHVA